MCSGERGGTNKQEAETNRNRIATNRTSRTTCSILHKSGVPHHSAARLAEHAGTHLRGTLRVTATDRTSNSGNRSRQTDRHTDRHTDRQLRDCSELVVEAALHPAEHATATATADTLTTDQSFLIHSDQHLLLYSALVRSSSVFPSQSLMSSMLPPLIQ